MPQERKTYRAILAQLSELYPGQGAISLSQAAAFYGVCERTLKRDKTFPIGPHNRVSVVNLARWMAI